MKRAVKQKRPESLSHAAIFNHFRLECPGHAPFIVSMLVEEEAKCVAGRGEFLCLLVARMFAGMLR